MQIQLLVIQVPDMWKISSKFSILRTYIVRYYFALKFCLIAKYFKESDKKYAKFQENDKSETAEFFLKNVFLITPGFFRKIFS